MMRVFLLAFLTLVSAVAADTVKPNILFITTDDMSCDSVGDGFGKGPGGLDGEDERPAAGGVDAKDRRRIREPEGEEEGDDE